MGMGGRGAGAHRLVSVPLLWPSGVRLPAWVSVYPTVLRAGAAGLAEPTGSRCRPGPQGEFRVVERKITMKEVLRALEEGRVREVFGSGTACQVCPVHRVLYQGQVRRLPWRRESRGEGRGRVLTARSPQNLHIPTMDHGPELILRFQKELTAIQVRRAGWEAAVAGSPRGSRPGAHHSQPLPPHAPVVPGSDLGPPTGLGPCSLGPRTPSGAR